MLSFDLGKKQSTNKLYTPSLWKQSIDTHSYGKAWYQPCAKKDPMVSPSSNAANFSEFWTTFITKMRKRKNIVGGFNPSENMLVKLDSSSPIFEVKIPKIFELPPPRNTGEPMAVQGQGLEAFKMSGLSTSTGSLIESFSKSGWKKTLK